MSKQKYPSLKNSRTFSKGIDYLVLNDENMSEVIKRVGRIRIEWDPDNHYEALVRTFICQQISGKAADAIIKKFMAIYSGRIPSPKEFLDTESSTVMDARISPQKYSYICDLCTRIYGKELNLDELNLMPDEELTSSHD